MRTPATPGRAVNRFNCAGLISTMRALWALATRPVPVRRERRSDSRGWSAFGRESPGRPAAVGPRGECRFVLALAPRVAANGGSRRRTTACTEDLGEVMRRWTVESRGTGSARDVGGWADRMQVSAEALTTLVKQASGHDPFSSGQAGVLVPIAFVFGACGSCPGPALK